MKVRTGVIADLRFVAGMFGVVQDPDTGAISPEIGWAIVHGDGTGKRFEYPSEPLTP